MTTRRWLIAAAVFAIMLGGGIEGGDLAWRARAYRQTGQAFQRQAREAWMQQSDALRLADSLERSAVIQATSPDLQESAGNAKKLAEFHHKMARMSNLRAAYNARLAEKYEYASRHPWLPVEPDPPEPK
jgi:hypothetical protein